MTSYPTDATITFTPRRDAFDAGPGPMSTATPSCCCSCCCCCLNTVLAASAYEIAEIGEVAKANDRDERFAPVLGGLIGGFQLPAAVALGIWLIVKVSDVFSHSTRQDSGSRVLIAAGIALIVLAFWTAAGALAYRLAGEERVIGRRMLRQSKKLFLAGLGIAVEFVLTLATVFIAQLAAPVSAWFGWKRGRNAVPIEPDSHRPQ